jgi:hypothetical protein
MKTPQGVNLVTFVLLHSGLVASWVITGTSIGSATPTHQTSPPFPIPSNSSSIVTNYMPSGTGILHGTTALASSNILLTGASPYPDTVLTPSATGIGAIPPIAPSGSTVDSIPTPHLPPYGSPVMPGTFSDVMATPSVSLGPPQSSAKSAYNTGGQSTFQTSILYPSSNSVIGSSQIPLPSTLQPSSVQAPYGTKTPSLETTTPTPAPHHSSGAVSIILKRTIGHGQDFNSWTFYETSLGVQVADICHKVPIHYDGPSPWVDQLAIDSPPYPHGTFKLTKLFGEEGCQYLADGTNPGILHCPSMGGWANAASCHNDNEKRNVKAKTTCEAGKAKDHYHRVAWCAW